MAAARACVNHPRGARVEAGRLTVSSIYAWFREDFGANEAGVIAHLKRYARPALATALEAVTDIEDYEYDWALNDARADALALLPLPGATVPRPDQDRSDPHRGFDRTCESGLRL